MSKHILVTGANSGIGKALCKLLIKDHNCYVYLGCRNVSKGEAAISDILEEVPDKAGNIEVLQIDVSDDASCIAAANVLKAKGVTLFALVNNAGVGLANLAGGGEQTILNTNYLGPKRVTDAIVGLIDSKEGRIVNTSSGAASMWLRGQDPETKALFSNPNLTLEELDAAVQEHVAKKNFRMGGYGLSKAALCALTLVQAKAYPNLLVTSLVSTLIIIYKHRSVWAASLRKWSMLVIDA